MVTHRTLASPVAFFAALAVIAPTAVTVAGADGLSGPGAGVAASELATDTLEPITPMTPEELGSMDIGGLAYADPTEALTLIESPEPTNSGSVELSYPIAVPPGHGITPDLTVGYSSGGDNGWMGLGWDLSVGEVTIDTTFGAPHFSQDYESESYLLDGDLLTPNANSAGWDVSRVDGDKADYARQVETDYEEIIRHQSGDDWPADYYWEVRAKDGSVRWYGGTPDSGGPAPATRGGLDEESVVRNDAGHIVSWKLSAQRDIGVNLIRYEYETVTYGWTGTRWSVVSSCDAGADLCGRHTYLDRILYTDATSAVTGFNGAPYEIDLLRESEVDSVATVRDDPVLDARLGYVDVIVDRLSRIEVKHAPAPASGDTRTYTDIAARYDFDYEDGPFGKTLLSTIGQGVDDVHEHTIQWHDDLGWTDTSVDGFGTAEIWDTGADVADRTFLDSTADVSVLGGAESNSGSGNIYIGFNPITPSKTGSFGAGLELSGGDSKALVEWVDLNGDNLPDKVFLDSDGVTFRLNDTGPDGAAGWQDSEAVNLPGLSEDSNFAFQISGEAYPIAAIGVGTGLAFSWTNSYFSDVNGDGLVDFVHGGTVYFNHLDSGGIPTFEVSSDQTPIPLDPSPLPSLSSVELAEVTATLDLQSPPIDTVRRFTAPFTGSVLVSAPVALESPATVSADGVRVAIQYDGDEIASETLLPDGTTSAFAADITLSVEAGDHLYFRAGAVDDGAVDAVTWAPVITYQSPAWPQLDANGLSQHRFSATDDFTLAGRPDDFVALPAAGTVQVAATLTTTAPLTDDVTVVALKRAPDGTSTRTEIGELLAGSAASTLSPTGTVEAALTTEVVTVPGQPDQEVARYDVLSVYLEADSPVDLADVTFAATLTYLDAQDVDGTEIPLTYADGSPFFEHHVRPHVEIYPYDDVTSGSVTTSDLSSSPEVELAVQVPPHDDLPATVGAVVTVKSTDGLEVKRSTTLTHQGGGAYTSSRVDLGDLSGPDAQWVEVLIRDSAFSRSGVDLTEFVEIDAAGTRTDIDGVTLRWSGQQGIFPQPYRGWAVAGFTAGEGLRDTAMDENAFELSGDPDDYSTEVPTRDDVSLDEANTEPSYAFLPAVPPGTGQDPVATPRWVGPRAALFVDADTVQTTRLGVDSVHFDVTGSQSGEGRGAPTRLGITGPGLTASFGIAILGASVGLSPSWGITDFEDLNGDGYPDVVSAGSVTYTDQLGTYLDSRSVDRTSVTNQDLTVSINGGLSSGMVDIAASPKGSTNTVKGDSSNKSQGNSDSGPSYSLGVSASGGYSWSSPNASAGDLSSDPEYSDQVSTLQSDFGAEEGAEIQRALADVNGDGLPDSVYTTGSGTYAFYNLGYGFTPKAAQLATGGFESRESATGGAGLGFSLPYGEFGGGVNLLWNYDWSTYAWNDVNGDGILDRLRRESDTSIKVAIGTGSGLLPEISYGAFAAVPVSPGIDGGQHVAFDRASGIGGGASATGYIGPLCLVACYLVIGGGGGYNQAISSSNASVEDVNGDGFADVLLSLNDDQLTASLNRQNRTNLLSGVTNPLGGSFEVDYTRVGNTTVHPDSLMVMSRVDVHDGRSTEQEVGGQSTTGDYVSTISYDGLDYDRAHRASLGFDTVTVLELDSTDSETPLRRTEYRYLNDDVFVTGLLTDVTMSEPDGAGWYQIRGSSVEWGVRTVRAGSDVPAGFDAHLPVTLVEPGSLGDDAHTVASRGWSIAPLPLAHEEYWFDDPVADGEPQPRTFAARVEMSYDGLGNVLVERDLGAADDDHDDLVTTLTYSDCTTAGVTSNGCLEQTTPRQPFWSPGSCVNWASYPTEVVTTGVAPDGDPVVIRHRRAPLAMCDNGAATVLDELVEAPDTWSSTSMTLNAYGDYALVMAPVDAQGVRYTVAYTYDADRHSDIAQVTEYDVREADADDVLAGGPTAATATVGTSSSATFDPLSGRVASRTDANGVTRSYAYDEHGRIVSVSAPSTTGAAEDLITYEYHANDTDYGYAIARHTDTLGGNPSPAADDADGLDATATIDTVTFVDGLGRERQTKRDARLSIESAAPVSTRQVDGVVAFDPLARPVVEFGPTVDPGAAAAFSPDGTAGLQTVSTWYSYDLLETVTEPGDRVTAYEFPWETFDDPATGETSPLLAWTVITDPEGRVARIGQDVRDVTRFHVDEAAPRVDAGGVPVPAPESLVTAYRVNSLGELTSVVDSAGMQSTYTYDLAGRPTSASTPDGGTVATTYDLAGHPRAMVTPDMAALGLQTQYSYTFARLTGIDHPGTVDDVTYTYGLDNADGRMTAGRIADQTDRTRLMQTTYDLNGNVAGQTAVMKRHNWEPGLSEEELDDFRYTTTWSYDDLGRLATVGFPDAKSVTFLPDGVDVGTLTSPDEVTALLESADLAGETATYRYDSGGLLRGIAGEEEGISIVPEQLAPDPEGVVQTVDVPRRTTHAYPYLVDRVYDPRLLAVREEMGNGTTTDRAFDPDTWWLTSLDTTGPTGNELQDISYTYDVVGRPLTTTNDLPLANRAINGGRAVQSYDYDGFGRIVGATGTFDLKAGEQQRYDYGVEFTPDAPWSMVAKGQDDSLHRTRGKASITPNPLTTYSFTRELGTATGPLQAVSDTVTLSDGTTGTYDADYTPNGALDSFLLDPAAGPSPTNLWDRSYTWTLMGQMTSVARGAELKTYAYDDLGTMRIKDGNLLTRDGEVLAEHGGGPETLYLNPWVTVRAQKIYKQIDDGDRTVASKMDSGGADETTQMFAHHDLVGSTNIVSDVQGRGFQRHEYFPSGEIWISDQKEEIRTPFQFGDGYYEASVDMILFGTRWYDAEREVMLSPDPLLVTAPRVLIDQPALGAAYTFAGASPTANVDPTGLAFFSAHQRLEVRRADQANFESRVATLLGSGDAGDAAKAQKMVSDRDEKAESQNKAESLLDANALIQIDPYEGTVSVGAPYGPRKTWGEDTPTVAAPSDDAADDQGGPDDGSTGVSQGSVSPSVADDSGDADAAGSDSDASDSGSTGSVSDSGQRQSPVDPADSNSQG